MLRELGVRPSRKLGQNFLTDVKLLQSIATLIDPQPDELIIEIGPGVGNLTDLLLPSKPRLIGIEYDTRLSEYLQQKYRNTSTVDLLQGDAARINYEQLTKGESYRCIGNLPYSSSSVIVSRILVTPNKPESMHLLLQKEMAERVRAQPGSKSYGSLSVRTQVLYDIKVIRTVPSNLFWPIPKIDSAWVRFDLKDNAPDASMYKELTTLVNIGFSHRRKKMISNLRATYDEDILLQIIQGFGFNQLVRPEQLTAVQYLALIRLYRKLNDTKKTCLCTMDTKLGSD